MSCVWYCIFILCGAVIRDVWICAHYRLKWRGAALSFLGWQYLFVCLLKYFRQTFTLRMIMFGHSIMSSVVVCISAGCLVFSSASAVTQIFVFVTNKTESSFGAHCMLSDFSYFCLVSQQRKWFFCHIHKVFSERYQEIK